jgi:restriction system protein
MAQGVMYEIEIRHDGLNKYRHIRGRDRYVVEEKARTQAAAWDEQWDKKQAVESRKSVREQAALEKEAKKQLSQEKTTEAQAVLSSLEKTLAHTLDVDDAIDWDSLRNHDEFQERRPAAPANPSELREPRTTDPQFKPKLGFFTGLMQGLKKRKIDEARALYESAHEEWKSEALMQEKSHGDRLQQHKADIDAWEAERAQFLTKQEEQNAAVDDLEQRYRAKESDAVEEYCDLVLSSSQYPDFMPKEYELEYKSESRLLIIEYRVPSLDDLPTLREVKYVQSRDAFDEIHLKQAALNKAFDSVIYQICLRTIHEIFESDVVAAVDAVAFNGWVEFIDRATGNDTRACIMSIQTAREPFLAINLSNVEPKECFKSLKGVGSSKLHGMAPIAPVVRMSREDPRFVQSVDIVDQLEEGTNLASIDWQEFEHLIREVFENEFSKSGGEVKVTQASRDGGVDAIAFDPDPIRGGKIVIQAKRYTNVVGVSAVRDLYGTILNEGASKGILVTTSSYGPDAYEFAKGKPITLLDGGNLLHLLGQHGHKARIDLAEAKRLAQQD